MTDACRCDCAYVGAQLATEPTRCEQCRGLVDEVAAQRMDEVYEESRRRLMEWAEANPIEKWLESDPWPI